MQFCFSSDKTKRGKVIARSYLLKYLLGVCSIAVKKNVSTASAK
jgi:hypothetical protein